MSAIDLHARATPGFDERVADTLAVLRDAAQAHAGRIVQATSLGAEDMVLTDLIVKSGLPIEIFSLDTGRLPLETYDLMAAVQKLRGRAVPVEPDEDGGGH